jgi:hypothetical protein
MKNKILITFCPFLLLSCSSYKTNEDNAVDVVKADKIERVVASSREEVSSIQDLTVRVKKLENAILPISPDIPANVNLNVAEMSISFREKYGVEVYSQSDLQSLKQNSAAIYACLGAFNKFRQSRGDKRPLTNYFNLLSFNDDKSNAAINYYEDSDYQNHKRLEIYFNVTTQSCFDRLVILWKF